MSRSILKSSNGNRLIPIPANEGGSDPDCASLNKIKPWSHVDEEPLNMADLHGEMKRIQDNLDQMRDQMMIQMPPPPKPPFDPIIPPLLPPLLPPLPLPGPIGPDSRSIRQMMLPEASSPYGSLDRRHRAGPLAITTPHPVGFGAHDIFMPPRPPPPLPIPMSPMSLSVPGPTPTISQDEHGNRIVELVLDLKGFMPEDIHIHTEGSVLHVHARRLSAKRDVIDGGSVGGACVAKDCRRRYTLPDVVRAENLRCFVNARGQLTIEGALGPDIVRRTNRKKVKFVSSSK
ncbi:hypothetical protein LSH36_174g09001 [Paralvinella palmiformis]|uniref:SHSP domain-containing protein n=1 Tax=Paralvinella palmiformis TaxID=53620 RepID=A0AAD9JTH8_9ANNE|nr:hypothetical protein LSH36_174g09001 [Paralvinella palmiformis]